MEIRAEVGGRPGIDCGGFCEFCLNKNLDYKKLESLSIGCIKCPPNQIGCDHCREPINRIKDVFKPYLNVLVDLEKILIRKEVLGSLDYEDLKINIMGGADLFCYPQLKELLSALKKWSELPVHLGYTSGKGIKDEMVAKDMISKGVIEVSFSVISTDPEMIRKLMRDKNPEESLKALKIFCENVDVNASTVVIPGVNDEDEIFQTCCTLEEWGVKSFVLRRFANFKNQGLILNNNNSIIEGINIHSYEEFQELVQKVADDFSFPVYAFPFFDHKNDIPFAISKPKNRGYLERLPQIKRKATILTSKLAGTYLKEIFEKIDAYSQVNVISLDKEIADLITYEDLESIDLNDVKATVIIPSGALIHDRQALELLNQDARERIVVRGPYVLTNPYIENRKISQEELIDYELKSFKALIDKINSFGTVV